MLLAIDTTTSLTGVACYGDTGLQGECTWESGRNHTRQLLMQLHMLLQHIGRNRADIQVVAVALGPGSWSGLRVGISIAKGLALAGDLPVLGVSTLDVLAYQHRYATMSVYPLIRLGRERFATAEFRQNDTWTQMSAYRNVILTDLCRNIDDQAFFCGDIDRDVQTQVRNELGERAYFPGNAANVRRPGYLAELAWQRHMLGEYDNIAQLEPTYLGEPVKIVR